MNGSLNLKLDTMENEFIEIQLHWTTQSQLNFEKAIETTSNKILDIFEPKYANAIRSEKTSYQENLELAQFLESFITQEFDKQIHYNLLAALSFMLDTDLTLTIKQKIRDIHFKS